MLILSHFVIWTFFTFPFYAIIIPLCVIFFGALLLISVDNFDFTTNFTAVAATINNIGPGLGLVGPTQNFSGYSDFSTFILAMVMLTGRLEIFPMLMLFAPTTWKK